MSQIDSDRLVFMPDANITAASGMCNVMRDYWFCVDPEKGLIFYQSEKRQQGTLRGASPQANLNKSVTDRFSHMYPGCEVKQYPMVLVPIDVSDYA